MEQVNFKETWNYMLTADRDARDYLKDYQREYRNRLLRIQVVGTAMVGSKEIMVLDMDLPEGEGPEFAKTLKEKQAEYATYNAQNPLPDIPGLHRLSDAYIIVPPTTDDEPLSQSPTPHPETQSSSQSPAKMPAREISKRSLAMEAKKQWEQERASSAGMLQPAKKSPGQKSMPSTPANHPERVQRELTVPRPEIIQRYEDTFPKTATQPTSPETPTPSTAPKNEKLQWAPRAKTVGRENTTPDKTDAHPSIDDVLQIAIQLKKSQDELVQKYDELKKAHEDLQQSHIDNFKKAQDRIYELEDANDTLQKRVTQLEKDVKGSQQHNPTETGTKRSSDAAELLQWAKKRREA